MYSRDHLNDALELYELGLHVFPLGRAGTAGAKRPRFDWMSLQTTAPTDEEVERWWTATPDANIAIATGTEKGVVIVDTDTEDAAKWVTDNLPPTPWRVQTANGIHFYYRVNPDFPVRNSVGKGKVDVRGFGGYVVAPGSVHETGVAYVWQRDQGTEGYLLSDLPMITAEMIDTIGVYNGVIPQRLKTLPTKSLLDYTNGESWGNLSEVVLPPTLEEMQQPVAEGGRNDAAARLAGSYVARGASLTATLAALRAWNETNPAPLPDAEIELVTASVARTHANNTGQPVRMHEGVPVISVPTAAALPVQQLVPGTPQATAQAYVREDVPRVRQDADFSYADLMAGKYVKYEELMGGLLFEQGRMLVAGEPKIGKTTFVISMAMAIAGGKSFLLHQPDRALKVYWLQAENWAQVLAKRMGEGGDLNPRMLYHTDEELATFNSNFIMSGRMAAKIDMPDGNAEIVKRIKQHQPDIVIFDPLVNFISANENDNREMSAVLQMINAMAEDHDFATVILHHVGKLKRDASGQFADGSPFEKIRGASALRGWYDTGIMLTRVEDENGDLLMTRADYETRNIIAPKPHGITNDRTTHLITSCPLPDPPERKRRGKKDKGSPDQTFRPASQQSRLDGDRQLVLSAMARSRAAESDVELSGSLAYHHVIALCKGTHDMGRDRVQAALESLVKPYGDQPALLRMMGEAGVPRTEHRVRFTKEGSDAGKSALHAYNTGPAGPDL